VLVELYLQLGIPGNTDGQIGKIERQAVRQSDNE
jgi:hypothetical protein